MRRREKLPQEASANWPLGTYQNYDTAKDSPITRHCKRRTCGQSLPFSSFDWLDRLELLLARNAGALCITPDLASLTIIEAWGLFHWLREMSR